MQTLVYCWHGVIYIYILYNGFVKHCCTFAVKKLNSVTKIEVICEVPLVLNVIMVRNLKLLMLIDFNRTLLKKRMID